MHAAAMVAGFLLLASSSGVSSHDADHVITEPAYDFCSDQIFSDNLEPWPPTTGIVASGPINVTTNDFWGIYIDWTSGYYQTTQPDGHHQFDFNPYIANSEDGVDFYWSPPTVIRSTSNCLSDGDDCKVLQAGDIVGPTVGTFSQGSGRLFRMVGLTYAGISFLDDFGRRAYGYVELVSFSDNGAPITLVQYAFSTACSGIRIPPEEI